MAIIGYETLPVASVMAFFVGMVLALQTGFELEKYGRQNIIGAIVGHSMVRELGPVMTSFLVAGRVGSAMAAELGVMTVYEEIDALKTLDIDPVRYLAMPRFIACLICLPILRCMPIASVSAGRSDKPSPSEDIRFLCHLLRQPQRRPEIQGDRGTG